MRFISCLILALLLSGCAGAQEPKNRIAAPAPPAEISTPYDYFSHQRQLIGHGLQAVLMCNGLFTSNRTLEQVFEQELAYSRTPNGNSRSHHYHIDEQQRFVTVGDTKIAPAVTAVFREGIGCVVMAPNQSLDQINTLPSLPELKRFVGTERMPWPDGDLISSKELAHNIDAKQLQVASDWAFERDTAEQDTLSLLIVHDGIIIHERYAEGITKDTRTRTWSTAKSIGVSLIGILVDQGKLKLDQPLEIDWLPELATSGNDPRNEITLRHVLNMSSGLYPVDSFGMEYATGSGLAYWAGDSSIVGARSRALVREPGTYWEYENYDTLLAVYAMKKALGDDYLEFPRNALLEPLGMRNTLLSTDRFGDFIMSSQIYTNARDLARFGLLYLNQGQWNGRQIISPEWIEFVRTPAPSTSTRGNFYGGQWWLVPDDRNDVPKDAYSTAGNRGQYVIVIPSHNTVIVRRGLDYGNQGFNRWDMTREVLKAISIPDRQTRVTDLER